jgi:murein DD-endopeptidase MepM/ murein hydrolase activator NlpD
MRKLIIFCILVVLGLPSISALTFKSPIKSFVISSELLFRVDPFSNDKGGNEDSIHRGIDIVPKEIEKNKKANVAVSATEAGTVFVVYPPPGYVGKSGVKFKGHPIYGGLVVISHGEGCYSLYGHMKEVWVYEGMKVQQGASLGLVGSTGKSTGPHLHFEIDFDPWYLLQANITNARLELLRKDEILRSLSK